jgi:hypothetical protein
MTLIATYVLLLVRIHTYLYSRGISDRIKRELTTPTMANVTVAAAAPSMISLADRRVTDIPAELESKLCLEPFCNTCNAAQSSENENQKRLKKCSSCKLVFYCSRDCQQLDWRRHKIEDGCPRMKKLRRRMDRATDDIREHRLHLIAHYIATYGDEVFGGRNLAAILDDDIFELLAGRFYGDDYTAEYMDALVELSSRVHLAAVRRRTVWCWEEDLALGVEVNRLTHISFPDMTSDGTVPSLLIKLHRDDDAVSFILYWLAWRSGGAGVGPPDLRDPSILNSRKNEWPFACQKDCRLVDIMDRIEHFHSVDQDDEIPIEFLSGLLTIKMRHITVHRSRVLLANQAFLDTKLSDFLLPETRSIVLSFLTGGEKARETYEEQLDQANRLMDHIDNIDPNILLAFLLGPELLASQVDSYEDIKLFHESFAGEDEPVMKTLTSVLSERRGRGWKESGGGASQFVYAFLAK